MAAVAAELDWLVEVCEEGDQAIIYFSGHGDVEAKTARQPGFLLTYDSPPKIYIAGAYPLFYLQLIVETLSSDKNVQTLIITDACRAGKLAGSEIGGTQATAANLAKQYANEIKILSCQPDEFSLEGEQWGGGRGAFSYHLIEGLIGLADKNENGSVNLLELENYLETVVPEETDPQSQIPMTIGNKGTKIADVDAGILARLKDLKVRQLPTLAAIETRGFEETLLANADSAIQKKYEAFIAALEDKNLLDAQNGQPSADDLYRELIQEESLADLHRFMTRQYATALQDDAQQAINAYLLANPTELEKRWKGDTSYSQYPRYLSRAAELLGKGHYMHDFLVAKQLYFEGLNLRLQADQGKGGSYQEAIEKQEAALELEGRAAFFYNELGVLHTRLKLGEQAASYYQKAIELAPEWGLPYVNYCLELFYAGEKEKAIEYGEKALTLLPDYPQLMNLLGWIYADRADDSNRRNNWRRAGIELKDDFTYRPDNVLTQMEKELRFERIIELLERAVAIDPEFVSGHLNLGISYTHTGQYEKAIFQIKKAVQLDSSIHTIYARLGEAYKFNRQYAEAEKAYIKAIGLVDSTNFNEIANWYVNLGNIYMFWGKLDEALQSHLKAIEASPFNPYAHGNAANTYRKMGLFEEAERHRIRSISGSAPVQLYGTALLYKQLNRFEDAEYMLLKAVEMLPDYTLAKNNLINLYQEKGDYEKAIEWGVKLLETAQDDPAALISTGWTAYLMKEHEKAEAYFQRVFKSKNVSSGDLNNIGWFLKNHGDYQQAEKYLNLCIATKKDYHPPYANLALLYHSFNQYKKSIDILEEGLISNPDNELLLEMKTTLGYFAFPNMDSKPMFEAAAKTKPAFLKVWDFLEQVRQGEYAKATQTWGEFEGKIETWYFAHIYLGALVQKGDIEAAIELMDKTEIYTLNYHLITTYPLLEPLRKEPAYQSYMRRNFPEKYDDLDTFEFVEPEPIYYPENCLLLADFYESEGEHVRAKFLREKAAELEAAKEKE